MAKNSKKLRATLDTSSCKLSNGTKFWFGFLAMDALATDARRKLLTLTKTTNELVKNGYLKYKAHEQYHFIQKSFNTKVDKKIGLLLVDNILFQFDKPQICYIEEDIINITKAPLDKMEVELDNTVQPIAPLCNTNGSEAWNNMIKVHLKQLDVDRNALLEECRIFALLLDGTLIVAKIAKEFSLIAPIDQLLIKIMSNFFAYFEPHKILTKIVKASF